MTKNYIKIFCSLLVLFNFLFSDNLDIRHYDIENGLPSNMINSIYQDIYGYVWIGTNKGLTRFDGIKFKSYNETEDEYSVSDDFIFMIEGDSSGLFIHTQKSIEYYDFRTEKFTDLGKLDTVFDQIFTKSSFDNQGNYWISKGSRFFQIKDRCKLEFQFDISQNISQFSNLLITDYHFDSRDILWITTFKSGLIKIDPAKGQFEQYLCPSGEPDSSKSKRLMDLYIDNHDNIWIGIWNQGVLRFDREKKAFEQIYGRNSTMNDRVLAIEQLKENKLLFAAWHDGIKIYDVIKNEFVCEENHLNPEEGKKITQTLCMTRDKQGNIWIGSAKSGLTVIYNHTADYHLLNIPGYNHLLANKNITLTTVIDNKLYIGTNNIGLIEFDLVNQNVFLINNETCREFPSNFISNVMKINDEIWIGTSHGLVKMKDRTFQCFPFERDKSIEDNLVFNFYPDTDTTFLIITPRLHKFNQSTGQYSSFNLKNENFSFWKMTKFGDYFILLSSKDGIIVLDENKEIIKKIQKNNSLLENNYIYDIAIDENYFWFSMAHGLFYFDKQLNVKKFEHDMLDKIMIISLVTVKDHLWGVTNKSIVSIHKSSQKVQFFNSRDNIHDVFFLMRKGFFYDNALYFAFTNGILYFSPDEMVQDYYVPIPKITEIKLFNEEIKPGKIQFGRKLLMESIERTRSITLNQDDIFTVDFALLNYIYPEKNSFAFKLHGIDKTWVTDARNREVTYHHLPHGNYTFLLKAANHDGVWNSRAKALQIKVLPKFWQTFIFKLFLSLSIILMILSIIIYKNHTQKQKEKYLSDINSKLKNEIKQKHTIEKKLTEINFLLNSIMDAAREVSIITTDSQGLITYFNTGAEIMLEYTKSEIVQKKSIELLFDRQEIEEGLQFYKQKQFPEAGLIEMFAFFSGLNRYQTRNWKYITKSGNIKTVNLYVTPIPENNYDTKGYLWIAIDLSDLKKNEETLKESERKLSTLLSNMPGMAYRCLNDEKWTLVYASKGAKGLTGYEPEQMINNAGFGFNSLIHPDDLAKNKTYIHECIINHNSFETTYRIITKNNRIKWIWEKGVGIYNQNGQPVAMEGFITDISESIYIRKELEKTKIFIDEIINSMPSKILSIDKEGFITHINTKMRTEVLAAQKKIIGKNIQEIFPSFPIDLGIIRNCIFNKEIRNIHKHKRMIDGKIVLENIVIYPILDISNDGAVIRIDDVTDQVKMEEMMVQSEKMLSVGGLAAGMAHEINNPLAGIIQNSLVLKNRILRKLPKNISTANEIGINFDEIIRYMEKRQVEKQIELVLEAGKRASEIVHNMLSFSKQSKSRFSFEKPTELMEKTLELAQNDYNIGKKHDFRKILIKKLYEPGIPEIYCEASKLQQVFLNILKNGSEAMFEENQMRTMKYLASKEPVFTLKIYRKKNNTYFEIGNNGPNIPEENKKRIFEPFFTTKGYEKGTGLGLSVSYFIITENHHGSMHVESEEGSGTNFVIRIPDRKPEL
ncbi:MAG: PAS domain S-box protein [Candidatus Marinimicrobia bacterium]|nr:PAS domain S-box protein [Candidatus Neomarinimicrobiota bacterium]